MVSLISVNDTMDDILNESGDEEESDQIVNQVLDEIGIEIAGKVRLALIFTFKYPILIYIFHSYAQRSVNWFILCSSLTCSQVAEAPSAVRGKIGETSLPDIPTSDDLEAQLAKLRAS